MKINYADYIKKLDVSVLVAEAIFSDLQQMVPLKTISQVAETSSGGTPLRNNSEYYNGDIPWLKSGELNDGFITNSEEFITEKGLKNSSAKLFPEGTLLLAMYGATVGKTGITKMKAATNQAICAIFPKAELSQDFLFWFLKQHRFKFINIIKGGAQPNISQFVINDTCIPIPNKSIQDKIVNLLNGIHETQRLDLPSIPTEYKDKVVKVYSTKNSVTYLDTQIIQQLDLLKKLRQQILQDAVQGKLVPQNPNDEPANVLLQKIKAEKDQLIREKKIKKEKPRPQIKTEEIPFELPGTWLWCRLGELGICKTGTTPPTTDKRNFGKYIPFIKPGDISLDHIDYDNEGLSFSGLKEGVFIIAGSLLMVCIGGSIGKSFYNTMDISCNQQINTITPLARISSELLQYFLQSEYFQKVIWVKASGGTTPIVNRSKWESIPIPLPPLSEQFSILTKLDQMWQICDELEQTIKQNQNYTQQLLQVALKEALEPK